MSPDDEDEKYRCHCGACPNCFVVQALRADRDEALQWIREFLPEVENLYAGCESWERSLTECRGFLGRER